MPSLPICRGGLRVSKATRCSRWVRMVCIVVARCGSEQKALGPQRAQRAQNEMRLLASFAAFALLAECCSLVFRCYETYKSPPAPFTCAHWTELMTYRLMKHATSATPQRSDERRVGTECGSPCRSR